MKLSSFALAALLVGAAGTLGVAKIKAYTLPEILTVADNVVYGEIVASNVYKTVDPEGHDDYFTTLTVVGKTLSDGTTASVDVTFAGGFLNDEEGVWNSEAPMADDVKVGNRIVAFYDWSDLISQNGLIAAHGGLYRTVTGGNGPVVLGRGDGYAIRSNVSVQDLEDSVRRLRPNQNGR